MPLDDALHVHQADTVAGKSTLPVQTRERPEQLLDQGLRKTHAIVAHEIGRTLGVPAHLDPWRRLGRRKLTGIVEQVLQHALDARDRDLARHDVLDQFALFLRQLLQELLHLAIGQQVAHVVLQELGQVGRQHGGGVDHRPGHPPAREHEGAGQLVGGGLLLVLGRVAVAHRLDGGLVVAHVPPSGPLVRPAHVLVASASDLGEDERSADLMFRIYRKLQRRDLGDIEPVRASLDADLATPSHLDARPQPDLPAVYASEGYLAQHGARPGEHRGGALHQFGNRAGCIRAACQQGAQFHHQWRMFGQPSLDDRWNPSLEHSHRVV